DALAHFGVGSVEEVYARLATAPPFVAEAAGDQESAPVPQRRRPAGFLRQWSVLTRRSFESLARNRLTMAILIGSPAMVVAMFAVLFRPGAFDFAHPSPSAIAMIVFWVAFGAFFFG